MLDPLPDIPGYRITGQLGQGSFGVVLAGESASEPSMRVAIKLMRPGVRVRTKDVLRFQREGKVSAELHHENILPILEVGRTSEHHYIVMARIEGETLQQRIKRRNETRRLNSNRRTSMEEEELARELRILAAVCRAADYAHRHGVIHRDIKPANVLVQSDDHPYLIDFGLARHLQDESTLTSSGVVVGTFFYMAPEQLTGEAKRIGPASDVYALGATLYTLCTGRLPFTASTYEELRRKVLEDEVPRAAPGLPKGLESIWLRALEKEPQHRYSTAGAMAKDLERVAQGLAPQGRGAPLFALRSWRVLMRERRVLVSSVIVVLMAASLFFAHRAHGKDEVMADQLYVEGDIALLRGEFGNAMQRYEAASKLRPEDAEAPLRMAVACASFDLRDRARDFIARARQLGFDPESTASTSAREVYCRALYEVWTGDLDKAANSIEHALRLDPQLYPCHLTLSRIEQKRGNLQAAQEQLRLYTSSIAALFPSWTIARAELAEVGGQFQEAVVLLTQLGRELTADSPDQFRLHSGLGRTLSRLSRWPEARSELERAIQLSSGDASAWANLSLAQYRTGARESASASSKRALDLDPVCRTAHAVAGWLAVLGNSKTEAELHLPQANPAVSAAEARRLGQADDRYQESERERDAGREAQASELCRRALEFDPEHFGALLALAQDEAESDPSRAAELFDRADVVARRMSRPLDLDRDLWNTAYFTEDSLLALAIGRFSIHASLGEAEPAREARDQVLALFEKSESLETTFVVNFADAVEHSRVESLQDWCAARRWLESHKLAEPLDQDLEATRLVALCRTRCP